MSQSHPAPAARFWAPVSVLIGGGFVIALDNFIVNVAIPHVKADLGAGYAAVQLIVVAYGLAYGISLVTGGRLGDLYGRKRCLMLGLAGFTAASALCGLAPSAACLILARLLQGVAASVMFPQVLAMLRTQVAPERRSLAFALLGIAMGLGGTAGQLLGGVLVEWNLWSLGWRLVFLVNLPVGLVGLVAAGLLLEETVRGRHVRFDFGGVALAALTLSALLTPLIIGRELGWPLWAFGLLAASLPLGAWFVGWERQVAWQGGTPIVDLSLFRSSAFVAGLALSACFYTTLNSFYLSLTLVQQMGLGATAFETALVYLPLCLAFLVGTMAALRVGGRRMLDAGILLTLVAYGAMAMNDRIAGAAWSSHSLMPALTVLGFGQGLFLTPLLNVILSRVEPHLAGGGAGMLATFQQAGGALGIAVVGLLFFGALDGSPAGFRHGFELAAGYGVAASLVCLALLRVLDQVDRRRSAAPMGATP
jgi:EmrB/QacA subfamily drug resistance transporter